MMSGTQAARRLQRIVHVLVLAALAVVLFGVTTVTVSGAVTGKTEQTAEKPLDKDVHIAIVENVGSGLLAAGIVAGLSSLAAGVAVAYVGAAAVGAVSEKPEVFGRAIVFVAIGEGLAVLGLVIAIMILGNVTQMLNL